MIRGKSFSMGMALALMSAAAVLPFMSAMVAPRVAYAESAALTAAQSSYDAGKFSDAVTKLKDALAKGAVTGGDIIRAKELLGRAQAKAGDTAGARATFLGLLRQDPQYRLDRLRTPPDEVAAFDQALRTFQAEQLSASHRVPASINLFYGIGSGDNERFGEYVAFGGGDKKFDNKPMFGLGVRFPLRPRLSIDLEIQRFRATNEDSLSGAPSSGNQKSTYELSALPIVVSLHYSVRDGEKTRVSVFGGGGPMLNSYASDTDPNTFGVPVKITDSKVGVYLHTGLEGEYSLHPKLAINARALYRMAKVTDMYDKLQFNQYDSSLALGTLGNRDLDFSGYGLSLGLRAYIGY